MLKEDIDPSGNKNSIFILFFCYFLKELISELENITNLIPDGSIIRWLIIFYNYLDWFVEKADNLNENFCDSCLNQNLLYFFVRWIA